MSTVPNLLGAFWAEWPVTGAGATTDEATLLSVMAPYNMAMLQISTAYQLSSVRLNHLGQYPHFHFRDGAVKPLVEAFKADLEAAEATISDRDGRRFLSYPYLKPSAIPASIHI
jgi:hypothetical protein